MTMHKPRVTLLHRIVSWVGYFFIQIVGKTSFIRTWDDLAYSELRRNKKSIVYPFWHNNQVFLAYAHQRNPASVMVSRSKDGEYIAQVMKRLGLDAVRGSTTRGGSEALKEIVDRLKRGEQVGFTPDGPKGPVQTIHGGVVAAAKLSGQPLVPVSSLCQRRIEFNSWDRFVLPMPFGRVIVSHGKPFTLGENVSDEKAKDLIRNALNQREESDQLVLKETQSWFAQLIGTGLLGLYTLLSILLIPVWLPILFLKFGFIRSGQGIKDRLGWGDIPKTSKKRMWFHAASMGEWQALNPLFSKYLQRNDFEPVVTVSTPEARKVIKGEYPNLNVFIVPVDMPFIMDSWIKKVNPHAVFIVETELWPYLIHSLHKRFVPVLLLNGRLSQKSQKNWRFVKPFIRMVMEKISLLYVRSSLDAERFASLGAPQSRIHVRGNLKVDNLQINKNGNQRLVRKELFGTEAGVFIIAGSTWEGEEASLLKILQQTQGQNVRLILAPRRIQRIKDVGALLRENKRSFVLWSKVKKVKIWATDILLVDTLGDLKTIYPACDIAFIGGTLNPKGGQNPLEPAAAGLPILHGPSMENFLDEKSQMKKLGFSIEVGSESELVDQATLLIQNEDKRKSMAEKARQFVQSKQGVADQLFKDIIDRFSIKHYEA